MTHSVIGGTVQSPVEITNDALSFGVIYFLMIKFVKRLWFRSKLHATSEELQKKKAYIESVEPQLAHGGECFS